MPYDNKGYRGSKKMGNPHGKTNYMGEDNSHPIANKDTMSNYSYEMKDWRSKAKKDM